MTNPRIALALAAGISMACDYHPPTLREIDLGVLARLNAVESSEQSFVAVGAGGTVVRHYERAIYEEVESGIFGPREYRFTGYEEHVEVWKVGDQELRDVEFDNFRRIVVIGDHGSIHVGDKDFDTNEITWVAQEAGIDADLHGVALDPETLAIIVVGDDVLAIGSRTVEPTIFLWTEVPAPSGAWGRLRHVFVHGETPRREIWAIGAEGRAFTSQLGSAGWEAVDLGTDADLVDGGPRLLCGERGTLVRRILRDWTVQQHGDADFFACGDDWAIDADRVVHGRRWRDFETLGRLRWTPRAASGDGNVLTVVGDGGHAAKWERRP